jgi:hypothetical protein
VGDAALNAACTGAGDGFAGGTRASACRRIEQREQ